MITKIYLFISKFTDLAKRSICGKHSSNRPLLKNGAWLCAMVIWLFSSCSHTANPSLAIPYSEFPKEKNLKAQTIELDTALFRYPFRIRVLMDKVIVMDLHGPDQYCHVFQYPDFNYLSSFGIRGDSPEEMLSIENIRYDGRNLWTLDANKSKLTGYRFSSFGDSLIREEVISLDENILRALDFVIYSDSAFIIPDYSGDHRFCLANRKGKVIGSSGFIPTGNEDALEYARPALAQAWRSFLDYNPSNDVLAIATQLGEVLEIYNLKDSTHTVRIGEHGEPEFTIAEGYGLPAGIMGFSDVQVTDSAIYTVFHGTSFKEISRQGGRLPDGGKYIYVFSLKGEPLCKYVLDRYVYGIWVDEKAKTILATDVNNDQPIVKFRFN